jgi:hypothetical protein
MTYETGQLLWGAAKSVGNIWIVTDGLNRAIALAFDGKNKRYCPDLKLTTRDTIKSTSFLYELTDIEHDNHIFQHGFWPVWAQTFVNLRPTPKTTVLPNANLAPAVVLKVQKALGICLTEEPEKVILRKDESTCPINGQHRYVGYTGLIHSFEYCVHCDAKRS